MTLTKEAKTEIIQEHARTAGDTGSAEVQVAVLTKRIGDLTEHLKLHTQDHHYIRIDDRVFDSSLESHALLNHTCELRRYQCARTGNADSCA